MSPTLTSRYGKGTDSDATDAIVVQPLTAYQCHGSNVGPMGTLRQGNGALTGGVPFVAQPSGVVSIDMRNAARATGSGAGTQGDGITVGGPSYTLSSTSMGLPAVGTESTVRRLTELECERLQGFPDGWTDGQSGAARYRQLGNAVAVPVVEWIMQRLVTVHNELTS